MAKPSTPIPPDKIGENFAWRDWFQRLSDKVFGSMSAQDSNAVSITGGNIDGTPIGVTTASTGHFTTLSLDTALGAIYGGTGQSSVATGNLLYGSAANTWSKLAIGSTGQVLRVISGIPAWDTDYVGTVTSVGLALPSQFAISNSPVTSSGTLTAAWNTQTATYVLAGPTTGAAAAPTFRALASTDIPALSYAPQTSGTSILYGNGTGGFSNVTIGSGVSFVAGTLSATGSGGTITSVTGTAPVASSGGTTPVISMAAATTSVDGYLTKTDWATFNGKQTAYTNLTTVGSLVNATGWLYNNGSGTFSYSTPSKTDVGLSSVTNDAQTKASVVPNTVPSAGQLLVGNAGGTAYAAASMSGDATIASTGVITVSKFGGTAFGTAAGYAASSFQASGTYVTSVTGTAPVVSSGGTTPVISMAAATSSVNGYLTSTDWSTFNNKQSVAAPVTKTADFTVAATDLWLINNKSGSTCTVTLPTASSYSGRVLHFQNYQTQTVVSVTSNVVAITGGAAGTSILLASSGDQCTLVSDGTNWLMTQYISNNNLLLE